MIQRQLFTHLRAPTEDTIIVTALAGELPEALPEKVLFTGVGKVNATYVLTRYLTSHPEIKRVINYGTCGGAYNVKPGTLVKATTFLQGDMNCGNKLAQGPGITFGDDVAVSGRLDFGTDGVICRTQDQFVEDFEALEIFQHLVNDETFNIVDMEAYALAKVCYLRDVPFISFKYITDGADEQAHEDWESNLADGIKVFKKEVLEKL